MLSTIIILLEHTVLKLTPYRTASRFLERSKIHLPKVKHPKFQGHVAPNEDKCQKSVQLKFR